MTTLDSPVLDLAATVAARATGTDSDTVHAHLVGLYASAVTADLPSPSAAVTAQWRNEQHATVETLTGRNLPALHDAIGSLRGIKRLDGATFYAARTLLPRLRQQALVAAAPNLIRLDPPGTHAHRYTRSLDGRPTHLWYASYGSNLYARRFHTYLEGGTPGASTTTFVGARNRTLPAASIPIALPGTVHYAGESSTWTGAVAFLDTTTPGHSLGRAHLITTEQFDDVVFQECHAGETPTGDPVDLTSALTRGSVIGDGLYGTLIHVGDHDGAPVVTFTAAITVAEALQGHLVYTATGTYAHAADRDPTQPGHADDWAIYTAAPSAAYRAMIAGGLTETFGLTDAQCDTYFAGATGHFPVRPAVATLGLAA